MMQINYLSLFLRDNLAANRKIIIRVLLIVGYFVLNFSNAQAQTNLYLNLSTMKAKPLAMASAYTSIEDNLVSAMYNPATLSTYALKKNFRLTFFLNPVAPVSAWFDRYRSETTNFYLENQSRWKDGLLLFKGLIITLKFLDIGFVFNEQIIDENLIAAKRQIFSYYHVPNNCYHSAIIKLRLADRVSLGASTSLFKKQSEEQVEKGWEFSYGILMKPEKNLNVGISYHYFPKLMSTVRMPLEKMADQTVNVGLSYYPFKSTTLSLDLRNITEEKGKSVIEIRSGFEQRFFSIIALRAGYFRERFSDLKQTSAGIGLIDSNLFFSQNGKFAHSPFLINYAFVQEKRKSTIKRWHVLSLEIRF